MAVIHVIDDDASLQAALSSLLGREGYEVRGYASLGEFLMRAPAAKDGCILLDFVLGGLSGLELLKMLLRGPQAMPVVFLNGYDDISTAVRAMKAGAVDFLLKPLDPRTLLPALDGALASGARRPLSVVAPFGFSQRELAVLRGVVSGQRNRDIAVQLRLSERTIKTCRAGLMRRFGARSLADLIRYAGFLIDPASRQILPPSKPKHEHRLLEGV